MAKLNKKMLTLLAKIVEKTNENSFMHVAPADAKVFQEHNPSLVMTNNDPAFNDANGNIATRATEAGIAMVANPNSNQGTNTVENVNQAGGIVSAYQIFTGFKPPVAKRGGNKAGAPTKYPFDKLDVGASFFVGVSADTPDPLKTLSSTVANVNKKYSEGTGQFEDKERTKRGEKNKAVLNPDGSKVKETKRVELRRQLRKFTVRVVKSGVSYEGWQAPSDGVVVTRVDVNAA